MATQNKLTDLNNHLFEMLERLNDDELMETDLDKEIERSKALTGVGKTIIENGKLMLEATKHADEYGYNSRERELPEAFRLSDDGK